MPKQKKNKTLFKSKSKKGEYSTDENKDLGIPMIPEAPKTKKISMDISELSTTIVEKIKVMEKPGIKVVLVNCERCKEILPIPVPENIVKTSELPVVPISYVHEKDADQHCITIYLDHDFDIRRQRMSDVIIS